MRVNPSSCLETPINKLVCNVSLRMDSCVEESIPQNDDQDDYESYFLQPSRSPYNITEKIQQANEDLRTINLNGSKVQKVTFKENLVTHEPELTDDDVNSIESDHVEIDYRTVTRNNFNIFDVEEVEEIEEVVEEEIEEDLETEASTVENISDSKTEEVQLNQDQSLKESPKVKRRKPAPKSAKYIRGHVRCKNHCIDKIVQELPISIKKLSIQSKPKFCPPLKLQERKCCEGIERKCKEPVFRHLKPFKKNKDGTKRVFDNIKELQKAKLERIRQNEESYQRWLQNIAQRRKGRKVDYVENRPRTANHLYVSIEIPHSKFDEDVHIGDLIIEKTGRRKIHLVTSL